MPKLSLAQETAINILIIDSQRLFTHGMQLLLRTFEKDINIAIADLLSDAEGLLATNTYDLVLLDLNLPDAKGVEALKRLQKINTDVPIVVLSADENSFNIRTLIDNGAKGYIPKTTHHEVMIQALKLVLAKGVYLPQQIFDTPRATNLPLSPPRLSTTSDNPILKKLTARQSAVLHLVVQGKSNKWIAKELRVSNATIKAHLTSAYRRLGVSSRTEAIFIFNQPHACLQ